MNPKIDEYLKNVGKWQEELEQLRLILLDCGLTEEMKWRVPCYMDRNSNIALISGLKTYCALSFFKGALLNDASGILIQQTENVQAGRQIRFTSIREIIALKPVLKTYIYEAIELERAGLKVDYKKSNTLVFPEELQLKLNENPTLKSAFEALTPGRKKAYILHFGAAKQSKTRETRIEKCIPKIMIGKGPNDCTCGMSKRPPGCDGSHKYI